MDEPALVTVLTHGLPEDAAQLPPGWPVAAEEELFRELHQNLAGLVPGGRLVVAERSGHIVQLDQPELVVEAIVRVVAVARDLGAAGKPAVVSPPAAPSKGD